MEKVIEFLHNDLNIKYGDSIVVGVSGGPDSMALLHILVNLKKSLDIQIICTHVNHNIRKESELEKKFVEKYCQQNNIVFEYLKIEEYSDDNFHNEARSIRYKYFSEIVKKYNSKYLLTAHHGDDLIETILMRLVRGSTLRGYSGFSEIVKMKDYTIIRPLINLTKNQILEYNKSNKIEFVHDVTNSNDVYTRNRFRKYIVPQLKKEEVNVHEKFYKFSKTLIEYNDYIDLQVKKILNKIYPQNILNIELFLKVEKVIQIKIIYYILEQKYQDDLMLITDNHANLILNLINSKKANSSLNLPNNIKVLKSYNNLILIEEQTAEKDYEIEIIKYINLPNGKNIEIIKESKINNNNICFLNSKEIKMPIKVRNRRNGDKISVKGMLGRKKISDIFIDEKIELSERNKWPIVVDSDDNILWLPGLKKSKFDKTKDEIYDIILKYY